MFDAKYMCLCLCYVFVGINGVSVLDIDKCRASENPCLLASAQKLLPILAKGIPEYGMPVLDPLVLENLNFHEGELNLEFKKAVITGISRCYITRLERPDLKILLDLACPIDINGIYDAKGKLIFVAVEGEGEFQVQTDKVLISVVVDISYIDGKDGEKHWKVGNVEHVFDVVQKAVLRFENLFNGDQEKAGPVNTILDQNWKEVVQSFGAPFVAKVVDGIVESLSKFADQIPAKDLELY